jgi:hypothetical protein
VKAGDAIARQFGVFESQILSGENSLAGESRINGSLMSWIAAFKNLLAFSQGLAPMFSF